MGPADHRQEAQDLGDSHSLNNSLTNISLAFFSMKASSLYYDMHVSWQLYEYTKSFSSDRRGYYWFKVVSI